MIFKPDYYMNIAVTSVLDIEKLVSDIITP